MPILGITYGGAIAAGALGAAVYQGIHNVTHGKKIQEDIIMIGALSGLIGGSYTHPPIRLSPIPRSIGGQSSPLEEFYKAVQQERAQKAVINSVGIRNVISAYYGNIVGCTVTNTINIKNVSITSRPLKLIKQRYGEY